MVELYRRRTFCNNIVRNKFDKTKQIFTYFIIVSVTPKSFFGKKIVADRRKIS